MTEAGLSPPEEARVQQAADEAFRVLTGDEAPPLSRRRAGPAQLARDALRAATLKAPLQALAAAFLVGVLVARRR
jgi:hypothetical protein